MHVRGRLLQGIDRPCTYSDLCLFRRLAYLLRLLTAVESEEAVEVVPGIPVLASVLLDVFFFDGGPAANE